MPPCFCAACRFGHGRKQQHARSGEHAKILLHHLCLLFIGRGSTNPRSPTTGSFDELSSWAATPETLSPPPMAGPGRHPIPLLQTGTARLRRQQVERRS